MFVSSYSNMTGVTSEAGTAHPSGEPEFTPGFRVRVARSLWFCVKFSRTFLSVCPFWFGNWISALLRFTVSDYLFRFGIYKLFVNSRTH